MFKNRLAKGMKPPELPAKTVELQPLLARPTDPKPPPVEYTLRTVLFVDCLGNSPLKVYGVQVKEKTDAIGIKAAIRELALGKAVRLPLSKLPVPRVVTLTFSGSSLWWMCLSPGRAGGLLGQ